MYNHDREAGDGRRDREVLPASRADGFRYVSIMAQFILDDCCWRDAKPGIADWRSVAEV